MAEFQIDEPATKDDADGVCDELKVVSSMLHKILDALEPRPSEEAEK